MGRDGTKTAGSAFAARVSSKGNAFAAYAGNAVWLLGRAAASVSQFRGRKAGVGGCAGAGARSCPKEEGGPGIKARRLCRGSAGKSTTPAVKRTRYVWKPPGLPDAAPRTGQRAGRRAPFWDGRETFGLRGRSGSSRFPRLRGETPDRPQALAARKPRI